MIPASLTSVLQRCLRSWRRVKQAARTEIYAFWRSRPVRPSTVLYESFAGNGMLCNPEAIFRSLYSDPEFAHLRHVWVLRSREENPAVVREFADDRRVTFVAPQSFSYYRALATSGYLINNATFGSEFSKRPGQIYLNTWHGTPLKKMGFDIGDAASRVGNVIRNFLATDFLLSASSFMTEKLYLSAHALGQLYSGRVIEEGYPRIDHQFMSSDKLATARARLEESGVRLEGKKIILYAPTWKGTSFAQPEDDIRQLADRLEFLSSHLEADDYVVLLKTHQVVHSYASGVPGLEARLVPNEIPANVILGVTDVLITDYSSIFFDFLPTERPILFLTPDIADYAGYRGLYMEPEVWPGPVVGTIEQLSTALNSVLREGPDAASLANHRSMRERFTASEDGMATARIIDIVFRGARAGYSVEPISDDGRQTILINAGSMRPNGITSGLIGLLSQIDQTLFDVSIVSPNSRREAVVGQQRRVHPGIRQFARVGEMNGSKLSHLVRLRSWSRGDLGIHLRSRRQSRLWDDEWLRCFGGTTFDHVIDYSGHGPFWATLMLHAPGAHRSIWLHSDMRKDSARVALDRTNPLESLDGIFSLYGDYDSLISESPALSSINAASLTQFASSDKFVFVRNAVDGVGIERDASLDLRAVATDPETGDVPGWATSLTEPHDTVTFVALGRLAGEKNIPRLFRAFAAVYATDPGIRLLIVGDGPLRDELATLVAESAPPNVVILTGQLPTPGALLTHCDCLVVSSDYDAQPMVVLEAAVLGIPVVTVAFPGVEDALPPGGGLVVEQSDAALEAGIRAFLAGEVASVPWDWRTYNSAASAEFTAAMGIAKNS